MTITANGFTVHIRHNGRAYGLVAGHSGRLITVAATADAAIALAIRFLGA